MGRIAICQKCIAEIKQTYGSYKQNHDEWVFGNEVYRNIGSLLYYRDFVFLQLFQPIMAQLGNFDCHAVLWLVERYAEELNFRCTEKNPNGLDFDFSNAQNLEIGSTSEEKKREVFFAWDKEEQEGWLIKIERTLKVS